MNIQDACTKRINEQRAHFLAMQRAASARLDLDALELLPQETGYVLLARLAGLEKALPPRLERLSGLLSGCDVLRDSVEEALWQEARDLSWTPAEYVVVKAALTPGRIPALESALSSQPVLRRYSAGGQAAWLALEQSAAPLEPILSTQGLNGLVYFGPPGLRRLGQSAGQPFYQRVKSALDPARHFAEA